MARTVERIEKDLAALEENLEAIAQDFEEVYTHYLRDLGEAVSRQLILAVYQLCTREYPKPFLALTLNQRQALQQAVRKLARNGVAELMTLLEDQEDPEEPESEPDLPMAQPELPPPEASQDESQEESAVNLNLPANETEEMMVLLALQAAAEAEAAEDIDMDDPLNRLVIWQQDVEGGIVEVLLQLSHGTNRILHHAQILPQHLPEPVLEVAAKSSMMTEPTPGSPNLINLVIEAKSEEAKSSDVLRVVAVRLRLAEVEFANPTLSNWRSRLRSIQGRLSQVGKEYRKTQKERAIAQAELAWRSSWFED